MYPGGDSKAKAGNISLYLKHCSEGDFSVQQFHLSIKNKSGESVAEHSSSLHKFVSGTSCGWHNFADRDVITHGDVLNNGTLTVEVRMMPDEGDLCRNFIPKNPFVRNMLLLFLDEETADMSFEVESRPLLDASKDTSPALGEVFRAHKLVLKTCAKGSILGSLCEDCDGSTPVPINRCCSKGISSSVALRLRRGHTSSGMERSCQRLA
jgi:hypothetical protein